MIAPTIQFGTTAPLLPERKAGGGKLEPFLHLFEHVPILPGQKPKVLKLQITNADGDARETLEHLFEHAYRVPQGDDLSELEPEDKRQWLHKFTTGLFGEQTLGIRTGQHQTLVRLSADSGITRKPGLYVLNGESFKVLSTLAEQQGIDLGKELSVQA